MKTVSDQKKAYKKPSPRYFKRAVGFIHLWLGLISGLLVMFLGITGCILAFEHEIRNVTEPYQFVKEEQKAILPPSVLTPIAQKALNKPVRAIEYPEKGKAAVAAYWGEGSYMLAYLNPYTGEVLKVRNMKKDFFRIVIDGHFYLWLPPKIGKPIVASATLIFFLMLVSGIILWWPRNRASRKQRFGLRFNVSFKRLNYDLHNVLGFYASWIAVFIAITGLVMGFEWFARSVYFVSSGGAALPPHEHPVSDSSLANRVTADPGDAVYATLQPLLKEGESLRIFFPQSKSDAIEGAVNHRPGTYYNIDYYHYDQYTMKELPAEGVYAGPFEDARIADKIQRMNYDIHVGAILGLPGKILAFCASLIAASLPLTGFLIWRGRRRKKKSSSLNERPNILILESRVPATS